MRRAALVLLCVAEQARAAPWAVSAEVGGEVDSNVQRVETGPGLMTAPVTAGVLRFGVRVDHKDRLLGGGYVLGLSDLTRYVQDSSVTVENVTVLGGDLRWLHPLGERPVLFGFGLTGADALGITDPVGARTFRNLGADGVLVVRSGEDTHLTLAVGGRQFKYKPDRSYDWSGATATARLDMVLWQSASKTRSLELVTALGFEARGYDVTALVNACPPGAKPDPGCAMGTDISRRDRFQRGAIELTWVGKQVVALGYQATVIDSNSFGQSLTRHRVTGSVTASWGNTFATLLGILQIDQYNDGLLVQRDLQHAEFTNVEDENRSSLQLRLARKLSSTWSVEGRGAVWRNIAGAAKELAFDRELGYAGLIYAK
ncbi:MAG: hypothetical protein JWO36_3718 [Myxococcales bacterium]|nr:hypothetical protein [Myxococcales bacterium]